MPLKFRVWDKEEKELIYNAELAYDYLYPDHNPLCVHNFYELIEDERYIISQDTGLKDKNGLHNIYGGDIIDSDGNITGNLWQDESLLKDKTNLLITGMGTSSWATTEQEATKRGCQYAQ